MPGTRPRPPLLLAARPLDAHKGLFGRVLIVGGSRGMIGAPALAAHAALRSGAGLAQIAVPRPVQLAVAVLAPCATTLPLPADAAERIAPSADGALRRRAAEWADVVAIGPGMERSAGGARLVDRLLTTLRCPVVLDADGLNNACAAPAALRSPRRAALVLTPHAGEAARLLAALRIHIDPVRDRRAAATQLARAVHGVVVLKGHHTLVCDGRRLYENPTGNPGLATGGTGDVLTGIIAALLGQRLSPFDAARLGTFVHGLAGDLAAAKYGEAALIATDLMDALPAALRSCTARRRRTRARRPGRARRT
ncbi:MAG: NAD(P)H-hydrate dehydratase [Phycisphaerae bacterium]